MAISTPTDAFLSKSLSIVGISRALGDKENLKIRALLNIMIGDIILFLNVGKTMTGPQLTETVSLTVKHYAHFKPEDFKLCLEGVKKGNYGPLYDRIDGQVILSWFKAYDAERDFIAAEVASNKNEEFKQLESKPLLLEAGKNIPDDPSVKERLERNIAIWANRLEKNKRQRVEQTTNKEVKDPVWEMHKRWMQQYDEVWKRQNYPRFIQRYGRIRNPFFNPNKPKRGVYSTIYRRLDKNEFLEHKQWQYWLSQFPREMRFEQYLNKYPKK